MRIGKTTMEVVIKYELDHATGEENLVDTLVVTNNPDPIVISSMKMLGLLEVAKEQMLMDGFEVYSYADVVEEEGDEMLFKCIKCGNTEMQVITAKNKANAEVDDTGHYCDRCGTIYWIYKTEKVRFDEKI